MKVRGMKSPERELLLEQVITVSRQLQKCARSRVISIKLRTLLKYAYVSHKQKTTDLSVIRGLAPRMRPPSNLTNQYFYREIENVLKNNFKVTIESRRQFRYAIFHK